MPTSIEIEAQGLTLLRDRFARAVGAPLHTRLAKGMAADAGALKDVLARTAPRSPRPTTQTHLADAFTVSPVKMQGATFSVSIANSKIVTSRRGTRWSLLDIVTHGWGPGTRTPNPFVANALHRGDVLRRTRAAARQVAADVTSGPGPGPLS